MDGERLTKPSAVSHQLSGETAQKSFLTAGSAEKNRRVRKAQARAALMRLLWLC
jgi:hypothetical protein